MQRVSSALFTARLDEKKTADLNQAVTAGNVDLVAVFFINFKDEIASLSEEKKSDEIIKKFLNKKNFRGNLILNEAIKLMAVSLHNENSLIFLSKIEKIISILLENGANPNEINTVAQDALDCAVQYLPSITPGHKAHTEDEVKKVFDFPQSAITQLCVSLSASKEEEVFGDMLKNLVLFGATIKKEHIQLLQQKGYDFLVEALCMATKKTDKATTSATISNSLVR